MFLSLVSQGVLGLIIKRISTKRELMRYHAIRVCHWVKLNNFKIMCVQGNLDNLLLLKGGQNMVDQAELICTELSDKPFVFNLGHGVIKDTNPDDVALLVNTVKNFKHKGLKNVG